PRDYEVRAERGRGAEGRVCLATQPALADRPVVLKVTSRRGEEHLTLARLQHTHIVPLFAVHDDGANLRTLCMPFFGGATWQRLLEALAPVPPAARSGPGLLEALDGLRRSAPLPVNGDGPARGRLAAMSYPQAVCWIGACL